DRAARFYSIYDGAILGKPLDHEGTVPNVIFSPNGKLALTASAGGYHSASARLWELAPGDPVVWSAIALRDEGKHASMASFAPDGGKVLGIAGNRVREYDVVTGQPSGPIFAHRGKARLAFYSPDGRSVLTVGEQDDIRFWDRASGRRISDGPSGAEIGALKFSADGKCVAVVRADHRVSIYRIATGELQGPVLKLPPRYSGLILGPDGRAAYTRDPSDGVQEWDVAAGKIVGVRKAPGSVRFLDFVSGKRVVVTGEGRHLARAWDLASNRPISGPLADLAGKISTLAFSPDGRNILTGLWDRHNARLWDAATGKPIGPPVHHGEAVHFVAFTPDGKRMMSCSVNGEFRSQQVPQPLSGDSEHIRCWVEVLTGMQLDFEGTIRDLDADALQQRRQQLSKLGGSPERMALP
ncbi:MAG: WD40 repeat domain-containing protein, partial [Gemmataceae bacterium]